MTAPTLHQLAVVRKLRRLKERIQHSAILQALLVGLLVWLSLVGILVL